MLARVVVDQSNLGFRDIAGKYAADAHPACMNVEHDLSGFFFVHSKEGHQDFHHEIHRCEIIVEQNDLVQGRWLERWLGLLYQGVSVMGVRQVLCHLV